MAAHNMPLSRMEATYPERTILVGGIHNEENEKREKTNTQYCACIPTVTY